MFKVTCVFRVSQMYAFVVEHYYSRNYADKGRDMFKVTCVFRVTLGYS